MGTRIATTNNTAGSYAESIMGYVEALRLGEIVGSSTAGFNGNPASFDVPSGHNVRFTGVKVTKHDGTRHHGVGIQPTVPVKPSRAGIRAGRDEVLERALEMVREAKN